MYLLGKLGNYGNKLLMILSLFNFIKFNTYLEFIRNYLMNI